MIDDDFQVQQTYSEIGQMIFDEVVDAIVPPLEEGGGGPGWEDYADQIARKVRDSVLHRLDGWYEPLPEAGAA